MNYKDFTKHLNQLALKAHRDPQEIRLIAVSKNQSMESMKELYNSGCHEFGESRTQEALEKISFFDHCRWHFIGSLQNNKVNKAIPLFSLIHSVNSIELAKKISQASGRIGHEQPILLQINISGEFSKQGFSEAESRNYLEDLLALPNLLIDGLMTMAPHTEDTETIRHCFKRLRELKNEFQNMALAKRCDRAPFRELSMGMSNDYSIAIEEGSTLLRIGKALFS
jgi:PLP dependent protein